MDFTARRMNVQTGRLKRFFYILMGIFLSSGSALPILLPFLNCRKLTTIRRHGSGNAAFISRPPLQNYLPYRRPNICLLDFFCGKAEKQLPTQRMRGVPGHLRSPTNQPVLHLLQML